MIDETSGRAKELIEALLENAQRVNIAAPDDPPSHVWCLTFTDEIKTQMEEIATALTANG